MELVEDPGTDVLAEDTPVGLGLWEIVDITSFSPIEVANVILIFSSGCVVVD